MNVSMPPSNSNWKFYSWMNKVTKLVKLNTGLEYCGEIDQPFRDWYDEGWTPQDACHFITEEYFMETLSLNRN